MPFPVPYIIFEAILGVFCFLCDISEDERNKRRYTYIAIMLFVLFFGFRGYILTDWETYYTYFNNLEWSNILDYFDKNKDGFEPGYAVFCMLVKLIFPNYHFLVFVITVFNTVCIVKFSKRYVDNVILILILYVVFDGVLIMGNLLRNSISISLFLISIKYIEERRPVQYFSLIVLAITFHISAFVYLPMYFFLHRKLNKWWYLGIFIVINLLFVSHISFLVAIASAIDVSGGIAAKVEAYTDAFAGRTSVFSVGYLERLMTGTLIFLYYDKLHEMHDGKGTIVNSVLIYLSIFFVFSELEVFAKRESYLFIYGYWIIWADLLKCFYYKNNKMLFTLFIVLYCFVRTWSYTNNSGFLYENILTGARSYNERLYYNDRYFHEN